MNQCNNFKSGLTKERFDKLRKEVDEIFASAEAAGMGIEQAYEYITPMLCRTLTDEERKFRAKLLRKKWSSTPEARAKALQNLESYWTRRVKAKLGIEENK